MGHEFRTTMFVFSHEGHLYAVAKGERKMDPKMKGHAIPPSFYLVREDGKEVQIGRPMVESIRRGLDKLSIIIEAKEAPEAAGAES